jgi:flagellar basal body-associated protein FliL
MLRTIIIAVAVLVVGVAGGMLLMRGPLAQALGKPAAAAAKPKPPEKLVLVELEERTLNLTDPSTQHFLKATLALELKGGGKKATAEAAAEMAKEHKAKLMDAIITVASRYSYAQLLTARGKAQLKEELKTAFSDALAETDWKVNEVLYSDFVME